MARLGDLLTDLDDLLEPSRYRDHGPNGLQVPPPDGAAASVSTVVTAVSADLATIERAVELHAELLLVHHGLFWEGTPRSLDRSSAARLRALLTSGVALAAYHLPLDGHPGLGNNARLAAELGATSTPWARSGTPPIGVVATFEPALAVDALVERVERITERPPLAFLGGPAEVRRLAIVSGAAASMLGDVAADGLDGLLTGEPREPTRATAVELGVHAICAGHHATETLGVRALGDRLAERHGVVHRFVGSANPV
ncbi:MAG: Nif3-like dinuclear metal center hexameric protein [Solirubrobacteraceae bacterium]|nr:Nif3-like dinuclear metal center hexameric protein [Solirubrobacteraceae bacterium]